MSDAPLLMRVGVAYLQRRSREQPPPEIDDDVHVLNAGELAALRRVEWTMVARAAAAGAASGFVAACAEVWAERISVAGPVWDNWRYWLVVGGVTIVATVVEIAFLYWDALRSVHELSRAAGLQLVLPESGVGDPRPTEKVVGDLARAALELPNAPDSPFPVDPHRESPKWRLLVAGLLYKLKITLTSFLLKALLRRALGRVAIRVMLVFVGVPVCALWNAIVAFWIVREARLRAMGPSAARDLVTRILGARDETSLDDDRAHLYWSAIGAAVVRTHDLHPNLLRILEEFEHRLGAPPAGIDSSASFLRALEAADPEPQRTALIILGVATGIDGRLGRDERALIREAQKSTGRQPSLDSARKFARRFASGRPVSDGLLSALAR